MTKRRTVLITGASSGIGLSIAQTLARQGYRVFGTTPDSITPAMPGVDMLDLDVCSDASVEKCMGTVLAQAGGLDILINNAGFLFPGAVEEVTIAQAKAQFETNFFGVARMLQAVVPIFRRQKSGHILTVSSLAGIVPVPFWSYYNASKFAVEGLIESLRLEMKPFNVHVTLVEPGVIKTLLYANPGAPPMADYAPWRQRAMQYMKSHEVKAPGPERVANRVVRILAQSSPALRHTVTLEGILFPFMRRTLPARLFEMATRKMFNLDG